MECAGARLVLVALLTASTLHAVQTLTPPGSCIRPASARESKVQRTAWCSGCLRVQFDLSWLAATLVAPSHKQVLLVSSYSTMGRRRCLASVEQQGAGTVKRSEQRIRIVTHGDTRWQRRGKLERKSERKRERKKRGKGVQTSALPNLLVATVFILRPNKSSQLSLRNGLTQHQSIESACRGAPRGDI